MVKLTQESSLFNTRLALKLAVCRNPVSTILSALSILLITQTYLLRLAEGPAYTPHSVYVWDAVWVVFSQATTAYGAAPPATHIGRLAVVIATMCMPLVIATMTSLSTRALMLTPDEQARVSSRCHMHYSIGRRAASCTYVRLSLFFSLSLSHIHTHTHTHMHAGHATTHRSQPTADAGYACRLSSSAVLVQTP